MGLAGIRRLPTGWSLSRISPSRAPHAALAGRPTLAPPLAAMRSAEACEKTRRRKGSDKVWVENTVLGPPMCYVQECAPRPGGSQPPVGLRLNIADAGSVPTGHWLVGVRHCGPARGGGRGDSGSSLQSTTRLLPPASIPYSSSTSDLGGFGEGGGRGLQSPLPYRWLRRCIEVWLVAPGVSL
jgi:hypothetical protein